MGRIGQAAAEFITILGVALVVVLLFFMLSASRVSASAVRALRMFSSSAVLAAASSVSFTINGSP